MTNTRKKHFIIITIGCFLSYLIFGLFDSLKGTTLPALIEDTGYTYSLGGTIIMGQYAGYFTATLFTGIITDYLGKRRTLIAAILCLICGVTGYSFSSSLPFLLGFIFLIGVGLGSLELAGCNIITEIYKDKKGRLLNILTAIAGIGAIISPAVSGYLLGRGLPWRMIYRYGLLIAIPVTFYFFLMSYPADSVKSTVQTEKSRPGLGNMLARRELLLMYLVNFSYMAAEIAIATWMVDFYQNVKHCSVAESSTYLSVFFIGMTAGRLLGSFFVDRIGHMRSVFVASGCACLCILLGVFGTGWLSATLALTGFFYSIIFPTGTAIISEMAPSNTARVLGIYFACGGLGGMAGPWLLGIANDLLGLQWGMASNCLFFLGIMIPLLILRTKKCHSLCYVPK